MANSNYLRGEKFTMGYVYDFEVDGGAIGTINLRQFVNSEINSEFRVVGCYALVGPDDPLASAGTPTLTFGNLDNAAAYLPDSWAGLTDNGILAAKNNTLLERLNTDNEQVTTMTIGVAAITAGKLTFYLDLMLP